MNASPGPARRDTVHVVGGVPQYVTSRDAAALLGVPEPQVRRLIRDGTLAGFRAEGYWIASGEAVARYAASAEGALARLSTDFPGWRIGTLSWRYFAIADGGPEAGRVVFTARTVEGLRRKLEDWQAARAPVGSRGGGPHRRQDHCRPAAGHHTQPGDLWHRPRLPSARRADPHADPWRPHR